ncbi:MAG: acetylornithine transaminase [Akkermansia sp.]
MTTEEKFAQYVLPTYGRTPISITRGLGSRLWDSEGKCYLDFCAGIAVCALGHCNPIITSVLQKQAETLVHCSNLYRIPQQADLAEFIVTKCVKLPGKVFFSNSGAESNDGLIKTARRFGHRRPASDGSPRYEVLTFQQSFHGRTLGSMAATGQAKIQKEFDPLLTGFRYLPFNDLDAAKAAIRQETVAFLLEPLQGEGGVNPCTPEFLRGLAQLCKEHDLLLLIDEVQCGFARCGELMAWRAIAPEVIPDGVSWAKALGGGFPMGAFWISDRSIDQHNTQLSSIMDAGSHGSTYGGNPLGTTIGLAVLREIVGGNLDARAKKLGAQIRQTIESWDLPIVDGCRGLGLLIGIGINTDQITVPEGKTPAAFVVDELRHDGLLAVPAGPNTVRLLPPLNISDDELSQGLSIIKKTLSRLH